MIAGVRVRSAAWKSRRPARCRSARCSHSETGTRTFAKSSRFLATMRAKMSGIASIKGDSPCYQTANRLNLRRPVAPNGYRFVCNLPWTCAFHSKGIVSNSELAQVVERAEHLLWVIARQDVDCLSNQRRPVLRQLQELEAHARNLGAADLYAEVLRGSSGLTRIGL